MYYKFLIMRKFLLTILLILLMVPSLMSQSVAFKNESLNYKIIYHWGLIWKHAGSATLSLNNEGDKAHARLACRSRSWVDKMFKVRDTLSCSFYNKDLRPIIYRKDAHEGKGVVHDVVSYTYNGNKVTADCRHARKGRPVWNGSFDADGPAYDMLSIFYYIRQLDYSKMKAGDRHSVYVFSGHRKEILTVKYVGVEEIELRDESKHKAHHIKFSFTREDKKKSSDDMDTWISVEASKIPLMLKGKLPIGEVRCYYEK